MEPDGNETGRMLFDSRRRLSVSEKSWRNAVSAPELGKSVSIIDLTKRTGG